MSTTPDTNYRSYSDESHFSIVGETIESENPSWYDDILKLSDCQNVLVRDCCINPHGGNQEDGVDIMRYCKYVEFINCLVGPGKKYAFTIKGGSDMISLFDVTITGKRGREGVDIDIGNFSSTVPNAKTGAIYLENVERDDGRPVTVRVGWARRPTIVGGNVKVLFWQSLGLKLYVLFMRLCSFITSRL